MLTEHLPDTHSNYLSVRCVPIAEAQVTSFSIYIGEYRRSDFVDQGPRCALYRHPSNKEIIFYQVKYLLIGGYVLTRINHGI
jgi:hypothetical protein